MAELNETNINGPLSLEDTIRGEEKIEDTYRELINLKDIVKVSKPNGINVIYQIGNIKINHDSWVLTGTGTNYVKMNTESGLISMFGLSTFNVNKFYCTIMNADAAVAPQLNYGTQWWNGDGLYCYFNSTLPSGTKIRLNYIYFYFDN